MAEAKPVAPARLAATVMLLRDSPQGLEVFMVVRHHEIDFATGALVFPGGSVDDADGDARLRGHVAGAEELDDGALALRIAAIRESFEESGVLLARRKGERALVPGEIADALGRRYAKALEQGEIDMLGLAEAEGLEYAADLLVPFAHWITPEALPKRFDTWFFLVEAPVDHIAQHDGREAVESVWIRPADALAEAEAGKRTIIFPTKVNVEKLGRNNSVAGAVAAAGRDPIVTVLPRVTRTEQGRIMHIPIEAGYGFDRVHLEGQPGQFKTPRAVKE